MYENVSHVSFLHPRSKNQSSIFNFRTAFFLCVSFNNVSIVSSEFSCLVSKYRKAVLILRILFVCLFDYLFVFMCIIFRNRIHVYIFRSSANAAIKILIALEKTARVYVQTRLSLR